MIASHHALRIAVLLQEFVYRQPFEALSEAARANQRQAPDHAADPQAKPDEALRRQKKLGEPAPARDALSSRPA